MPTPTKRTELFVGLFIFAGCILLGGLVLQFGKFKDRLSGNYNLTITFEDASGVIKGSDVRMGGAKIGQVSRLPELNREIRVEVQLSIRDEIRIPSGSTFHIESATLLGDKLIVVTPPLEKPGTFISPASNLPGEGLTGLDAIQNNAEELSNDALRIVKTIEGTLGKIDLAVNEIRDASSQLNKSMEKINDGFLSDKNLQRIDLTLDNISTTTATWESASRQLEPAVIEGRATIASLQQAANKASDTFIEANRTLEAFRPSLAKIPIAVDQFAGTTRKAGVTLDRINAGEGLLGALAADNDVAVDAKTFMRNLKNHGILRYRNDGPAGLKSPPPVETKPNFGIRGKSR